MVTAHINADGDAVSSVLAVSYALKLLQKDHTVILSEPPQTKYDFLHGYSDIKVAVENPAAKFQNVITVDAPNLSRIAAANRYIADDAFIINIDHHGDNENFGNINIFYQAASTTEIIHELIVALGITLDIPLAEHIYTGIVFDTGNFRFASTTEKSFLIGAKVKKLGVSIDKITERVFYSKDFDSVKLLARTLTHLKMFNSGKVGVISVTKADKESTATVEQGLDDYINYLMMVKGVEVGIFMMETEDEFFRISLRAKNDFDVQKVAATFSGGGHKKASGCRLSGKFDNVMMKLVDEIRKYL